MSQSVQLCKYFAMCVNITLWDKDLQSAVAVYKYRGISDFKKGYQPRCNIEGWEM